MYIHKPRSFAGTVVVVDKSQFRPDSERVRAMKVSPSSGDGVVPQYDYNDGKIPKDDPVTDEILALRSGKLDRSEIEALRREVLSEASKNVDKAHAAAVSKAVDKLLGIGQETEPAKA